MKKLFVFISTLFVSCMSFVVLAQETHEAAAAASSGGLNSFAFGAAIIMAAASGLGTLAQSRAAAAALDGIARNPQAADQVQKPLILSLALMESLVIFALVIAFFLVMKSK